jgi:hypothetical protein
MFAASTSAQVSPTSLLQRVGIGEYVSEQYTAPPNAPATFVFFEGETVTLWISVSNSRDASETFAPMTTVPQDLFVIEAVKDRSAIPLQVAFENTTWKVFPGYPGQRLPISLETAPRLDARESLEWKATLTDTALAPGLYRVSVRVRATDGSSRRIRGQGASVEFELRARTFDAMPEILRRQADRLFLNANYAAAREAVDALLELHPTSFLAHLTRSRIAQSEGLDAESLVELNHARAILAAGTDSLFLQYARPDEVEEILRSLQ